eukprot:CAMPEP_0197672198 /NCGR_PEP_ID=MMETSP1338-20131121/78356_1 /TAXON_ID=43686 ORGANISM="Pelagodinium beii, Strain RCC1491" /NCGR_SAMPLE_ID=MMETSP1338 /ASSEMBLY_ACC=CAM_ASM_000754 /LENGTH=54 /DNA_ID=CAMNT_0043252245 /DNA_START=173 /DNA_END=333 /DNA_ORIENTATION=+
MEADGPGGFSIEHDVAHHALGSGLSKARSGGAMSAVTIGSKGSLEMPSPADFLP